MPPTATPTSRARQWLSEVQPLPGGPATRVGVAAAALIWAWLEGASGRVDLTRAEGWIAILLAAAPLAALAAGIITALSAWTLSIIVFFGLGSPPEAVPVMLLPGAILAAAASWLLPWRSGITVSIAMCGALFGLYFRAGVARDPLLIGMLIALACAVVLYRPYTLYRRRYEQSASQLRELRDAGERARREERTKLAHELHDIVAHEVTVIAMQARRNDLVGDLSEKAREINRGIGDAAQQTLHDLRRLVLLLRTDEGVDSSEMRGEAAAGEISGETTDAAGLEHTLTQVVSAVRGAGYRVNQEIIGDLERVPMSVLQVLRRTVRELGTNLLKHAEPAEPVEIVVSVTEERVMLRAANTPAGVRPIMSSQTGLAAMRARCEVFGGAVTAGVRDGRWVTDMVLPLYPHAVTAEAAPEREGSVR